MKNTYILIALLLLSFFSCERENMIDGPSEPQQFYLLPQGNNPFDQDIVELYNKYATYFIYKFDPAKDFAWTPAFVNAESSFGNTYECLQGDEPNVNEVLIFIKENWLAFYPDTFLKETLPFKVLLAKDLKRLRLPSSSDKSLISASTAVGSPMNTVTGYDHITISNTSEAFNEMTDGQRTLFKSDLHVEYWTHMFNNGKVEIPAGFTAVSNYAQTVSSSTRYQYGFLDTFAKSQNNPQIYDLRTYIKVITSNTKDELDATILNPTNDTNGLVQAKYDIVVSFYLNQYNIDLQAIGDATL